MSALPRGITQVYWKNKTKTKEKQVKFRVRLNKKVNGQQIKVDQLCDTLEQAKDLLSTYQSNIGRQTLNKIDLDNNEKAKKVADLLSSPPISFYIKQYVEQTLSPVEGETELKRRNRVSKLSFFKTIENTPIPDTQNEIASPLLQAGGLLAQMAQKTIANSSKKRFGDFKPEQITYIEINEYIKARLATPAMTGNRKNELGRNVSKISVSRELTFIKKLFDNLKHQQHKFKNIPNPVTEHDKDLLKNRDPKNDYRLSDTDREILFKELDEYPNPEMKQICLLSYYCGFRRSEIVPLLWEQVHFDQNYIQLYQTKSGRPRKVIITKQAREILESIPKRENDPRLFTYSLLGFSGSVDKFLERIGLKEKGFRFHFFRREAISNLVFNIGQATGMDGSNFSILISELLGIENVRHLEKNHLSELPNNSLNSQVDIMKSVGHNNKQTTKRYSPIKIPTNK
ncbi:site-specific integrase [Cupriavidus metallidurans]|jgi:integrase|uniref:site-specific integrase n=1 Tax=Cupriavidus metallidurans TaxID=119219 RepID=UPI0009B7F344|nr:tyrosine-type recombinase/integrase [Cupriavidus metallidurans]